MRANIAIGSNLDDPRKNVETAIEHICAICTLVAKSKLYATKPWGVIDQPDFCNAVVTVQTPLSPHELLDALQSIEEKMGRTKTYKWGPRLIDLDLLHYGDLSVSDDRLTIPHPHINERAFVLVPLAEIDSRFIAARDLLPEPDLLAIKVMPNIP
ncbi:MAG: 2-amino-4-hydroxy-6-hydroxymethyldihydropteridine diphosphokinase [Candidatus Obscuribacterales bacterium]|nr:2-amino-4-hydroxy-6-hydroxymethyldihydropteridine diphosphokinase [Candidatus Obscuribacterales bacterium]